MLIIAETVKAYRFRLVLAVLITLLLLISIVVQDNGDSFLIGSIGLQTLLMWYLVWEASVPAVVVNTDKIIRRVYPWKQVTIHKDDVVNARIKFGDYTFTTRDGKEHKLAVSNFADPMKAEFQEWFEMHFEKLME